MRPVPASARLAALAALGAAAVFAPLPASAARALPLPAAAWSAGPDAAPGARSAATPAPKAGPAKGKPADSAGKSLLAVYPSWGRHAGFDASRVPYGQLTHLVYSDFVTDAGGALRAADPRDGDNLADLERRAHAAGVKLLLSVRAGGPAFDAMSRSVAARARFISACLAAADRWNADGLDLAWDLASPGDGDSRLALLRELRLAADGHPRRLAISSLVSAGERWAGVLEDEFFILPDLLVVSASGFDARGGRVRPVSDLEEAKESLRHFEKRGVPAERLLLESPFFGRSFDGASGLGSAYQGKGSGTEGAWRWKDLLVHLRAPGYAIRWDDASRSEVAVGRGEAIVFHGILSQRARGAWLRGTGYAGAAVLDLASDTVEARMSLLVALRGALRGLPAAAATDAAPPRPAEAAPSRAALRPVDLVAEHLRPGARLERRGRDGSLPPPSMTDSVAKEGAFSLEAALAPGAGCDLCLASPLDLAGGRAAGALRFWIRGAAGHEGLHVTLEDDGSNAARQPLKVRVNLRSFAPVRRGEWTRAVIPLAAFGTRGASWDATGPVYGAFNWSGVRCLAFESDRGRTGPARFWLDGVRFAPLGPLDRPAAGPGYAHANPGPAPILAGTR